MVWYGMVWYGMVWYGTVRFAPMYGMVWYGMVWYAAAYLPKYCLGLLHIHGMSLLLTAELMQDLVLESLRHTEDKQGKDDES